MSQTLVKFKGQPSNIGDSHLFAKKKDYTDWLETLKGIVNNLKVTAKKLTFDGGSATVEEVDDDFSNC